MNEKLLAYFRPKKVGGLTICFNCRETKESTRCFIDLFCYYVQKKKSSICDDCLDERAKYYQQLDKKGKNIISRIKEKEGDEKNKKQVTEPEKENLREERKTQENERKETADKSAKDLELKSDLQVLSEKGGSIPTSKEMTIKRTKRKVRKESREFQEEAQKLRDRIKELTEKLKKANSQVVKIKGVNNFLEVNKIYNLDCLKLFRKMKEDKIMVDAIITDPPYNISKNNNFASIGRAGIDFGHWDYGFDQTTWIKKSYTLLKKGGSIIIFNDWRNFGKISETLEEVGYEVKDLLRWIKKNPMPRNVERRYVTDYELAIWAVKNGKSWTFNFRKNNGKKPYLIPRYEGGIVIGEKRIHPTQKSLQVFKNIIELHTNVGDLILDPFIGSGTTAAACQEVGRNYIGSEIDVDYFNKAKLRINNFGIDKITAEEYIKSPINYIGNKYKLLKQIMPFFPKKINKFIDVFGGSGTMVANVPAKKHLYNDNDEHVVSLIEYFKKNSYEFIVKNVEKLIEKFSLSNSYENGYKRYEIVGNQGFSNHNKDSYKKMRSYYNETGDIDALFCLIIFGFNHQIRFNEKNFFNIPVGKTDFNKKVRKNLKYFSERLKNIDVELANKDFLNFLEWAEIVNDDFVYCDPPYLVTKASYNNKWGIEEEKRLLGVLDELNKKNIKFALSNVIESNGKKNALLIDWSKKYKVNFLNYSYNNSNYQRKNAGKTIEVLITNY